MPKKVGRISLAHISQDRPYPTYLVPAKAEAISDLGRQEVTSNGTQTDLKDKRPKGAQSSPASALPLSAHRSRAWSTLGQAPLPAGAAYIPGVRIDPNWIIVERSAWQEVISTVWPPAGRLQVMPRRFP